MESHLGDFVYISQGVLLHLFFKLTDGRDVIPCNGRSIRYMKLFHLAKRGSKRDARLQEDALSITKEAAEKHKMSLGDVKRCSMLLLAMADQYVCWVKKRMSYMRFNVAGLC